MLRNPDVTPYLTDKPPTYGSEAALRAAQANQPMFSPQEWQQIMGGPLFRLAQDAEELPPLARTQLQEIADSLGTTVDAILSQFR